MAIRLIINFKANPGEGSNLVAAFSPVMQEVRNEKGCNQYHLFQGTEDTDTFILAESWTDQESLDAHSAANRARDFSLADYLAGPTQAERYEID